MVPIPEASPQAVAFEQAKFLLWLLEGAWGFAILILLCCTGGSARLRTIAERAYGGKLWVTTIIFGLLLSAMLSAWVLPISWLKVLLRIEFGLAAPSAAEWLAGAARNAAIQALFFGAFLWVPYAILKRTGRCAWIVCWCCMTVLILAMKFVGPTWIDPIVKPLTPLGDSGIAHRLEMLASEADVRGVPIVVDNDETARESVFADVVGFGPGARIRVSNALLQLPEEEVVFAVAHEMGHFVLGHLVQDAMLAISIWFLALLIAQRLGERILQSYAGRFGFSSLTDVASAPLLAVLLLSVMAVCWPLERALARHDEREADIFALELTRNGNAAGRMLTRSHTNLSNPRRRGIVQFLRHDHPPLADRIAFANHYSPWESGEPLRFEMRFKRNPGAMR